MESLEEKRAKISRECIQCDGPDCLETAPTKSCSRCKVHYYCSRACQRNHCEEHKSVCDVLAEELEWAEAAKESMKEEPINLECGICFEVHPHHRVVVPGCRHAFCYQCLVQWKDRPDPSKPEITICPICRQNINTGVEENIIGRAIQWGARAARPGTAKEEKEQNLAYAFAELDKLLSAENEFSRISPLLTKARILHKIGDFQQALIVTQQILDKYKEAETNTEILLSGMKEAMAARLTADEAKQFANRVRSCDGKLIFVDTSQRLLSMHWSAWNQLAETKAELGKEQEAYDIFRSIPHEFGSRCSDAVRYSNGRRTAAGIVRCEYLLGNFDEAIRLGELCHQETRRMPEMYTLLALAYKANGDVEQAKNTMKRAFLHVSQWNDEFTKAESFELYDELHSA